MLERNIVRYPRIGMASHWWNTKMEKSATDSALKYICDKKNLTRYLCTENREVCVTTLVLTGAGLE